MIASTGNQRRCPCPSRRRRHQSCTRAHRPNGAGQSHAARHSALIVHRRPDHGRSRCRRHAEAHDVGQIGLVFAMFGVCRSRHSLGPFFRQGSFLRRIELFAGAKTPGTQFRVRSGLPRFSLYRSRRCIWKYGAWGPPWTSSGSFGPSSQCRPSQRMASKIASTDSRVLRIWSCVFDAKHKLSARLPCPEPIEECRASTTDVEVARRGWRKSRNGGVVIVWGVPSTA